MNRHREGLIHFVILLLIVLIGIVLRIFGITE